MIHANSKSLPKFSVKTIKWSTRSKALPEAKVGCYKADAMSAGRNCSLRTRTMRAAKTEKEENMNAAWALQPRMSMKRSSESSKIIQKPIQRLSKPENRILRGSGCAVLCCATTLNAKRKRERAPVLIRETHRLCMQWSSVQRPDHAERVSPRVISRAQAGPWRLAGILDKTSGVHSTLYRRRLLQANLRSWFFNTFIFRDIPYILKSPFGVRAWLHILWIIFYSRFFAWVKTFVNGERAGKPHFRGSTSSTIVKVKHKLYKTRLLEM